MVEEQRKDVDLIAHDNKGDKTGMTKELLKAAKMSKELNTTEFPKTAEPSQELPKAAEMSEELPTKELPKTAELPKETSSTTECPGTCRSCCRTTGPPRTPSLSLNWMSPRKRTK